MCPVMPLTSLICLRVTVCLLLGLSETRRHQRILHRGQSGNTFAPVHHKAAVVLMAKQILLGCVVWLRLLNDLFENILRWRLMPIDCGCGWRAIHFCLWWGRESSHLMQTQRGKKNYLVMYNFVLGGLQHGIFCFAGLTARKILNPGPTNISMLLAIFNKIKKMGLTKTNYERKIFWCFFGVKCRMLTLRIFH